MSHFSSPPIFYFIQKFSSSNEFGFVCCRVRQHRSTNRSREGGNHGVRRVRNSADADLSVERRQSFISLCSWRLLTNRLLLFLLKLRLLLLRRKKDARERTSHEEETPADGTTAATTTASASRTILRQIYFVSNSVYYVTKQYAQQFTLPNPRWGGFKVTTFIVSPRGDRLRN